MAEELSTAQHIITVDNFSPDLVSKLRGVFDKRFGGHYNLSAAPLLSMPP